MTDRHFLLIKQDCFNITKQPPFKVENTCIKACGLLPTTPLKGVRVLDFRLQAFKYNLPFLVHYK